MHTVKFTAQVCLQPDERWRFFDGLFQGLFEAYFEGGAQLFSYDQLKPRVFAYRAAHLACESSKGFGYE
jgi:hypothetical protein